jgi:hypothetical protein
MKQAPATITVLQEAFKLTEQEKHIVLESSVGEGLFFAGPKHAAIKIVASYAEDQFITSSPEELKKIKEAKNKLAAEE